jgi:hypothetical protein
MRLRGSDAWDGVRRGATVAAFQVVLRKPGAGAGKSAGLGLDDRARDGSQLDAPVQPEERSRPAALCKSDAGQSAA